MKYLLGPWVWREPEKGFGLWSAPDGCAPGIDLRTLPQCALAEKVEGLGLFTAPDDAAVDSEWTDLGNDPEAILPEKSKRVWEDAFGLKTLAGNRLHDVLWEHLTVQSDPTGDERAKPIVPTAGQPFYELWLGGKLVRSKRWKGNEPEAAPVLDMLRREYRENRAAVRDQKLPPDHHLKVLDYWCEKYRLDHRAFIPADLPDEGRRPHDTSISDSFDRANNSDISAGAPFPYTVTVGDMAIVSNMLAGETSTTDQRCRAESDLSSADHYAEVETTGTGSSTFRHAGPMARYASAADTGYALSINAFTGATGTLRLKKVVTGTPTNLGTGTTQTHALPDLIRVQISGSTLSAFFDGSSVESITDSAISSGTRTGVWLNGQGTQAQANNFLAEDLAAAGQPTARRFGMFRQSPFRSRGRPQQVIF